MKTVTRGEIICAMNASQYDEFVLASDVQKVVDSNTRLTERLVAANKRADDQAALKQSALQQIIDLRARLEAAEAQLKYGINCVAASPCVDLSGSIGKFRTRTGATYEYNPRTKQVLVDAGEFEQLHRKASIYREVGTPDYARDTIVVDRSTWQRINDRADSFIHRTRLLNNIAVALGAKEGEDVLLVARAVMRDRQGLSDTLKKARSALKQLTDGVSNFNYSAWYVVSFVRNVLHEYNNPKPTTGAVGAGS